MAAMAPGGLLHVTIISANLLTDSDGGSVHATADAYAAVVCGSHQFTTNTVANHETRPAWNESHTFRIDERNELDAQHILIEIFAEKPKMDELLGLAKIPLSKVIASGDETSVHSLNRPDDLFSGHVKVSLKWDSTQVSPSASKSAYPEAYVPCARYDPNAPTAAIPSMKGGEPGRSRSSSDVSHHEENYGGSPSDKRAHHRSSSYPSRAYKFNSNGYSPSPSSPSPSASASTSAWAHPPGSNDASYSPAHSTSSYGQPSNVNPPEANQSPSPSPRGNEPVGSGYNGAPHSPHGRGASPHIPYVSHQGAAGLQTVNGISNHGAGGHTAYQKGVAAEVDPTHMDQKLVDDPSNAKLSRAKKAEMAKLAELSRLTEYATGLSYPHIPPMQQTPPPKPKDELVPSQQKQIQAPPKPRNEIIPSQQLQLQGPPKPRNEIIPVQHKQLQSTPKPRNEIIPSQHQQLYGSSKPRNGLVPTQQQVQATPRPNSYIIPTQHQQFQGPPKPANHIIPPQQHTQHRQQVSPKPKNDLPPPQPQSQAPPKTRQDPGYQGPQYNGVQSQQLRVPPRVAYDAAQTHQVHYDENDDVLEMPTSDDETPKQLQPVPKQRAEQQQQKPPQKSDKADRKAEKAALKAALKAEKEAQKADKASQKGEKQETQHVGHIRQTLKMLRKTTKLFR